MKKRITIILVLIVIFFSVGFMNTRGFQNKAIIQSKNILNKYFSQKGEMIESFSPADYSLGKIEIIVQTDRNSYYTALGVMELWFVEYSILNYFVTPRVEILMVKVREKN